MKGDDRLTDSRETVQQPTLASDIAPTRTVEAVGLPEKIGPYSLVRTLGRGGMGIVYLALDKADREVALKVIPAGEDADPTDLARFQTEAAAVARLDHPNIVKLHEAGKANGLAYLAMEFVDGGTLYRLIKDEPPIDFADCARIVEQIARAIHYAHVHGVLHRDLKPSNILLAGKTPKLADFGLAKNFNQSLRLTQTGMAVGTPHYMAPEQARGESAVGPGLDIHGLGGILYELLTGVPPFSGRNPADTMEQVVHKKPTPPSQLRPDVPAALESICMKCLEKDPKNRYRTAEALANDLRRFVEGKSRSTKHAPATGKLVPIRVLWMVIAIAIGLIGLAVFLTWHFTSRAYSG